MEGDQRCETCRFYKAADPNIVEGLGICLRYPPSVSDGRSVAAFHDNIWPMVMDDEWCGEWVNKSPAAGANQHSELLDKNIMCLGLPNRTKNSLTLNDEYCDPPKIRTVGQLIQCDEHDLLRRNNFGAVSLREVREALAKHGLKLKGD